MHFSLCPSVCLLSPPAGMVAFYEVKSCDGKTHSPVTGFVRNYYVAAEKVMWNYAPSGKDVIRNVSLTEAGRWADNTKYNHCCIQPR